MGRVDCWQQKNILYLRAEPSNKTQNSEDAMSNEIIFLVEAAPEGGYLARALGHSIFTEADTWSELKLMVQDAVRCHFEERERPRIIRFHEVREEVFAL